MGQTPSRGAEQAVLYAILAGAQRVSHADRPHGGGAATTFEKFGWYLNANRGVGSLAPCSGACDAKRTSKEALLTDALGSSRARICRRWRSAVWLRPRWPAQTCWRCYPPGALRRIARQDSPSTGNEFGDCPAGSATGISVSVGPRGHSTWSWAAGATRRTARPGLTAARLAMRASERTSNTIVSQGTDGSSIAPMFAANAMKTCRLRAPASARRNGRRRPARTCRRGRSGR